MPRDVPTWILDRRQSLGDRVRELRKARGYTQDLFVKMSGIDRRTFQRIERGESDPTYGTLLIISKTLGVSLAELVRE